MRYKSTDKVDITQLIKSAQSIAVDETEQLLIITHNNTVHVTTVLSVGFNHPEAFKLLNIHSSELS